MSTIKATHLQHPSSVSPNLTLASDGTVSGGAGLGGLVHLHTETFSGQSSVSIDDVFSATYQNYRLVFAYSLSSNNDGDFRLRVGGSDDSTSNAYIRQRLTASSTTVAGTRSTTTAWNVWQGNVTRNNAAAFDIFRPFDAATTAIQSTITSSDTGAYFAAYVGTHTQATSYDGFTIYVGSGTITGTLRIYGYANS
jgi:hypothetical protein